MVFSENNFLNRLSLQAKFIIITTVAIIFFMVIIGYLAVEREKNILYSEIKKEGLLLGETLAIPIINDLIYERLGLVEEGGLLDNYIQEVFNRRDMDIIYIAILDEEGKVISHNDITEYGKIYSDPITLKALKSDDVLIQQFLNKGVNALDFEIPISIGKKRWGTLKFVISLQKVENEIFKTVRNIVFLTLFFLVCGFGIIILLNRRFLNPITQLANTMEKAGMDFLDVKVDVKGHDELAILGDRFNSMMGRIREANEELKKTHEKMVQSEKLASIGILASGVAHEINNPLGGLFNCIQMLRQNGENPDFREKYLGLIKEGFDRIENTVNKLLWMAKKGEHKPDNLVIKDAVENVFFFLEYRLRKNKINFFNKVDDNLTIFIDPHDFQQIALNLFINAMHAMPEGGELKVKGFKNNSGIIVEVTDTGIGIPQENITKVFDPFFTTKPVGEGTGLGLWLTYEIIRNYNGIIFVESQVEQGSKFTMQFPG